MSGQRVANPRAGLVLARNPRSACQTPAASLDAQLKLAPARTTKRRRAHDDATPGGAGGRGAPGRPAAASLPGPRSGHDEHVARAGPRPDGHLEPAVGQPRGIAALLAP